MHRCMHICITMYRDALTSGTGSGTVIEGDDDETCELEAGFRFKCIHENNLVGRCYACSKKYNLSELYCYFFLKLLYPFEHVEYSNRTLLNFKLLDSHGIKKKYLELDIVMHGSEIVIERHGLQHYVEHSYFHKKQDWSFEHQKTRDCLKKSIVENLGFRYFEIPSNLKYVNGKDHRLDFENLGNLAKYIKSMDFGIDQSEISLKTMISSANKMFQRYHVFKQRGFKR